MSEHDQLQPPQPQKKKRTILIAVAIAALLVVLGVVVVQSHIVGAPSPQSSNTTPHAQATTPTEQDYKALTTDITVAMLDKDGNVDKGKKVHFSGTILDFVKDSNGNTAGANVEDPNTSGVVQVIFPATTDLSQVNTSDDLEVWGTDDGTSSGTNAFGAKIQEVGVSAVYMIDHTTVYGTQ